MTNHTELARTWSHTGTQHTLLVGMQNYITTLEIAGQFFKKLHDLAIPTPRYLLRKMKVCVHTKIYSQTFIAVLFAIARNWKQSKCLPTHKWINCGITIQWKTINGNELLISNNKD